jgi:hypothetical protein
MATFTNVSATSLHTLDWNGDGKAEIAIGDRSQGRAFVVWGSSGLTGTADLGERANWIIDSAQPGDQFGYSLGSGDLDADGVTDLIVGSRGYTLDNRPDPNFNDAGAVFVLYGQVPVQRKVYLPLVVR